MGKIEEITISGGKLWIEDGIIRLKNTIREMTADYAIECVGEVNKISQKVQGKKLLLIDSGPMVKMSIEARKIFSTHPEVTKLDKHAVIVKNPVTRIIASFFMGIYKPQRPFKMFGSEEEAIEWLKE